MREAPKVQAERVEQAYEALAPLYDGLYGDAQSEAEDAWLIRLLRSRLAEVGADGAPAVLDVGCGTGWVLDALAELARTARYLGFDVSEAMLQRAANKHAPITDHRDLAMRRQPRFQRGSMTEPWPGGPGAFDLVVSTRCSASYAPPETFARRAAASLRIGGRVVAMPHALGNLRRPAHLPLAAYTPADGEYYAPWRADRAAKSLVAAGFTDVRVVGLRGPESWPPAGAPAWVHRAWLRAETATRGRRSPDAMTFLVAEGRLGQKRDEEQHR